MPTLNGKSLEDYDLIYFFTTGDKRWEWYSAGYYLNKVHGKIIVNKSTISGGFNYTPTPTLHYLVQSENKLPFPKTALVFKHNNYDYLLDKFKFPVVVKHSMLHQGKC